MMNFFANRRRFGAFLLAGLLWALTFPSQAAETLLVAAGAGYKRPVSELAVAFERKSGIKLEQIYGNLGQVLTQTAENGQVAIIFGDQAFLEKSKQVVFARYLTLGKGRLVLAWPKGGSLRQPAELVDSKYARIALPSPQNAIYGKAASEFLAASGLADKLAPRLLTVATVPQVSSYLVSGEVDAGFINYTDALGIQDKIGGFVEIDSALYQPIHIVGGVVQGPAQNAPAVAALEQFMASPEAHEILLRNGL
jgi:molybdate transport system substrate-binding protein